MKNLVDKEQAVALKEAGMPITYRYTGMIYSKESGKRGKEMILPDLDSAANWLREAKGLHVYADPCHDWSVWYGVCMQRGASGGHISSEQYDTHEAAQRAAISHALKMIKGL